MRTVGELTLQVMKEAGWYNNWLYSFIKPHIKGQILEVGAGIGNFSELLMKTSDVTAIDYEKKYVNFLQKKFGNKLSSGLGDIEKGKYFFKNKKFNTIVCLNVLEHIKNDKKALSNMFSLLQKSGNLILLVPAHMALYSKFDENLGHYRRYKCNEIEKQLKVTGFKNISVRYLNWWAAMGWFLFLKLTNIKKLPDNEVKVFNFFGKLFLWPEKFIRFPFGLSVLAIAEK